MWTGLIRFITGVEDMYVPFVKCDAMFIVIVLPWSVRCEDHNAKEKSL